MAPTPISATGKSSLSSPFRLSKQKLLVNGMPFLNDVPNDITLTPFFPAENSRPLESHGSFLGFSSPKPTSRHVAPIGKLVSIGFTSIFRFKLWWSTLWVGSKGSDLEWETQFLLLNTPEKFSGEGYPLPHPFVLILPIIDGGFTASLQPGNNDNIDVCVESCSSSVTSSEFPRAVYLHAGDDPYRLVKEAMRNVSTYLGTFRPLDDKITPEIVDKFGWCTWDAFYLRVDPTGVWEGVKSLTDGGCPPGFVLIDDGWQSICTEEDSGEAMSVAVAGEQMPCRLSSFYENFKFKNYVSKQLRSDGKRSVGLGGFVSDLKQCFEHLEYVYVWHAMCGYWGGVAPGKTDIPASVKFPALSPGLATTMEDLAVDKLVRNGIGVVSPENVERMFESMYSYLSQAGIDGVKVDVIQVLETLGEELGGRVELTKAYYSALNAALKKYFNGNRVIASMQNCNDFVFLGTGQISVSRAGDDFWTEDPNGDPDGAWWLQGCHVVHCTFNSLWLGTVTLPDWDMFQSRHTCGAFHAAARAISGGPVYVSDKVGHHDFELLRKLVLPDGSLLRCTRYALPTRDCLFFNPLQNSERALKIWNLNKCNGVVGAFNCQGGEWSREERRSKRAANPRRVHATVTWRDVDEWRSTSIAEFAVFLHVAGKLLLLRTAKEESIRVELDRLGFELFTLAPVRHVAGVGFAPIGLVNMLNAGGAVESVEMQRDDDGTTVVSRIGVRGCGELWAYSSRMPVRCEVNGEDVAVDYDSEAKRVSTHVGWNGSAKKVNVIDFFFNVPSTWPTSQNGQNTL